MHITLPFPPSINSLFGGGSNQKRFPSKKYKAWLAKCPKLNPYRLEHVTIHYLFYFPDNRERDCENYIKATTDFLVNQGVIVNDDWKHLREVTLTAMGVDKKNPRVEVIISIDNHYI